MIAAIYARKSTSQEKASEEARSVTRQIDLAKALALARQLTVPEEFIFTDDGISGGIFDPKKRPGLAALLDAARAKPRPFDVVITMSQSRFGRRQRYTEAVVHDLVDTGTQIVFYQTGLSPDLSTANGRFMVSVDSFKDDSYRESARITTRETLRRKAERGEVAGGIVYGYTNRRTPAGYVERVINPDEAAVIVRICELIAAGKGFRRIAKILNREAVRAPRGNPRGWAPTCIAAMARRPLYRGIIQYGMTQWIDKGDDKVKIAVRKDDWIIKDAPHLRIVADDLARAVDARLVKTRGAYLRHTDGRVWGRPETGTESQYLLTGLASCGVCGGSFFVRKRPDGRHPAREPYSYYACTYHHLRGPRVCDNGLGMVMAKADTAVLDTLREDILNPAALTLAIQMAIESYTRPQGSADDERTTLERDVARVDRQITTLVDQLADGGHRSPAVRQRIEDGINTRERERDALRVRLDRLDAVARLPRLDTAGLSALLHQRLADWRSLLDAEPVKARQIVRKLLNGQRLVFSPDPKHRTYTFEGMASYGALLTGVVQNVWCPRGDSNTRHAV